MISNCKYSEKELTLIDHYGFSDAAFFVFPSVLYPMMASKAFSLGDCSSPHANSLRRCINAMETGKVSRMTPEWDTMIDC